MVSDLKCCIWTGTTIVSNTCTKDYTRSTWERKGCPCKQWDWAQSRNQEGSSSSQWGRDRVIFCFCFFFFFFFFFFLCVSIQFYRLYSVLLVEAIGLAWWFCWRAYRCWYKLLLFKNFLLKENWMSNCRINFMVWLCLECGVKFEI